MLQRETTGSWRVIYEKPDFLGGIYNTLHEKPPGVWLHAGPGLNALALYSPVLGPQICLAVRFIAAWGLTMGTPGSGYLLWNPREQKRRWPNVGLMLGQRRRRWSNIEPTLGGRLSLGRILFLAVICGQLLDGVRRWARRFLCTPTVFAFLPFLLHHVSLNIPVWHTSWPERVPDTLVLLRSWPDDTKTAWEIARKNVCFWYMSENILYHNHINRFWERHWSSS